MKRAGFVVLAVVSAFSPLAAQQTNYSGTIVTGQLVLSRTVNVLQQARTLRAARAMALSEEPEPENAAEESLSKTFTRFEGPGGTLQSSRFLMAEAQNATAQSIFAQSFPVSPALNSSGFLGLTHFDQRQANGGNQFSIEPPSPGIAVANGFVVEGVNNAFQVYTTSGTPVLPKVLSTNELFGLPPAINRTTGVQGVFPTDMRVFYDQTINRWFVLQRAQDNDAAGTALNQSHIYLAVSQTGDPAGIYNIYTMDTTDRQNPGCPCVADYPQIGADQFGFYISSNEYSTDSTAFVNAQILAISKASLASGAISPTTYRFMLPLLSGYEFAIQPATTPPDTSYFLANGGLEYFVSTRTTSDNNLAVWAMFNTSSLGTAAPNLFLTRLVVPALTYLFPDVATQRPGPLPYGSTLFPPGALAFIEGGLDSRVLSVVYAGGRLYVTFATEVTAENGRNFVGGAYVMLSPTFRSGLITAPVLRQAYLTATNNHILRPAVAVNSQGLGAIAFTLVGPDHFPSAAFLTIDSASLGSVIQIAAPGTAPEDGFTGYRGGAGPGLARWGDYSAAVATSDGSIWMAVEYIPDAPRTQLANWGTFIARYIP